jgi:hypothetical protein
MRLLALVLCLGSLSVWADQSASLLESATRYEDAIREQAVSIAIPDPPQEIVASTLAYANAKEAFYIALDHVLPEAIDKAARKEPFAVFEQLNENFQPYRDRDANEIEAKTEIFLNAYSRDPDIERVLQEFERVQELARKESRPYVAEGIGRI